MIRLFTIFLALSHACLAWSADERPLTIPDIMKFRDIETPVLSEDGRWIAFSSVPDRGDPEGVIRATDGAAVYRIARGVMPVIDKSGRRVGLTLRPSAIDVEKAGDDKKKESRTKGRARGSQCRGWRPTGMGAG